MKQENCSICNGMIKLWTKKDNYNIYECSSCGFGQVLPKLSESEVFSLYSEAGHNNNVSVSTKETLSNLLLKEKAYPNATLDAIRIVKKLKEIRELKENSLLDIGSGYGFFSREFLKNNFDVVAIELAIHERNIFFELNGFYPLHISYEDFIPEKKFANIIMSQVLEHVNDPNNWILKSSTILQKNGIVIIALPNFGSIFKKIMKSKEPFIIPPYHLNYFTHKSLKTLLNNNDFEVIYSNTVTRIPLNKKFSHFPKIVIPILSLFGNLVLRFIDLLGYGSIINIYAKKK